MKRGFLYVVILAAVFFAPVEAINIGTLRPVQVVAIDREGQQIIIETDTDDKGVGITPLLALQDLKETAGGILYLDTAEYILVAADAQDAVETLRSSLKGSAGICMMEGSIDLKNTAKYLAAHKKLPKLKTWKMGTELPVLRSLKE